MRAGVDRLRHRREAEHIALILRDELLRARDRRRLGHTRIHCDLIAQNRQMPAEHFEQFQERGLLFSIQHFGVSNHSFNYTRSFEHESLEQARDHFVPRNCARETIITSYFSK